jgi:hypothetical protein
LAARIKKKDGEKLSWENIDKVIELLNQQKPITKKAACEMLNISYNTTRLTNIIEQHLEDKARDKRMREANRGKPPQKHEISTAIVGYLDGHSLKDIADGLYRPQSFVKNIVERVGVPQRVAQDYFNPPLLPDRCVSDRFEEGQIVWSARYQSPAIVVKEYPSEDYNSYRIYVIEEIEEESPYFPNVTGYGGRYATQAAYDLGSLEHLKEHGVDIYKPYRSYFPTWLAGR